MTQSGDGTGGAPIRENLMDEVRASAEMLRLHCRGTAHILLTGITMAVLERFLLSVERLMVATGDQRGQMSAGLPPEYKQLEGEVQSAVQLVLARPGSVPSLSSRMVRGAIEELLRHLATKSLDGLTDDVPLHGGPVDRPAKTQGVTAMPATPSTTTLIPTTTAAPPSAIDRCDRCRAQAKIRVVLSGGSDLVFCGHHSRQYDEALRAVAVEVITTA